MVTASSPESLDRSRQSAGHAWMAFQAFFVCAAVALLTACNAVPARQAIDEALATPDGAAMTEESFMPEGAVMPDAAMMPAMACNGPCAGPPLPCPTPCECGGACEAGTCFNGQEYICDGGDRELPAVVTPDWDVLGLEPEDTIAHYDTLDGERIVKPTNRVCIYAPRFGAVRKVVNPLSNEQVDAPGDMRQPLAVVGYDELLEPTTTLQRTPPQVALARKSPNVVKARNAAKPITEILSPDAVQDSLAAYENVSVIRTGLYQQSEKAFLAKGLQAAVAWTDVQAVQVSLNRQAANEVVGDRRVEAVYSVREGGCPMLRVIKVASTGYANPGDTVDFTIRFDNVGSETIGNVTIVDNLTPRLEYVPGSAQSSVKAEFSTEPNNVGSLVLRWEVADPLEPEQGGIVRFQCVVR